MIENNTSRRRSQSRTSIERSRRERKKRNISIILFCIVAFFLGYYILNYVASLERPPIGETFNIVLGCSIIAVSVIILVFTIKKQYFPKRKKHTKHIFLDEFYDTETKSERNNH